VDPRRQKFLASVLGEESAGLLIKTIDQTPVLEHAIVPRTILAWLQSAPSFEGEVLDGIQMAFEKSESGFTGSIEMGGESYSFEDANVFHVGASVAVALGMEDLESDGLRTLDITRLGKTIDLMSKVQFVNSNLNKVSPPGKFNDLPEKLKAKGYPADKAFAIAWSQKNKEEKSEETEKAEPSCSVCAEGKDHGNHGGKGVAAWYKPVHAYAPPKQKFGKDEPSAQDLDKALGDSAPQAAPTAAKPQKAGAPKAATSPAPKMGASKPVSTSTMSLTRSEAGAACGACGGHQFADDKFVGCLCFEAIAKSVTVRHASALGFVLELDMRTLDQDDKDALADAFKGSIDVK
jgi:hypothetical protein